MSRMDPIETGTSIAEVVVEAPVEKNFKGFMRAGKAAEVFCLWSAMAIPILLIIDLRF